MAENFCSVRSNVQAQVTISNSSSSFFNNFFFNNKINNPTFHAAVCEMLDKFCAQLKFYLHITRVSIIVSHHVHVCTHVHHERAKLYPFNEESCSVRNLANEQSGIFVKTRLMTLRARCSSCLRNNIYI